MELGNKIIELIMPILKPRGCQCKLPDCCYCSMKPTFFHPTPIIIIIVVFVAVSLATIANAGSLSLPGQISFQSSHFGRVKRTKQTTVKIFDEMAKEKLNIRCINCFPYSVKKTLNCLRIDYAQRTILLKKYFC